MIRNPVMLPPNTKGSNARYKTLPIGDEAFQINPTNPHEPHYPLWVTLLWPASWTFAVQGKDAWRNRPLHLANKVKGQRGCFHIGNQLLVKEK